MFIFDFCKARPGLDNKTVGNDTFRMLQLFWTPHFYEGGEMKRTERYDKSTADSDGRREFLKSCGRFAAVTPPTVILLLSTSLTSNAIAKSGGGGGHDSGSGGHDRGGGGH